MDRLDYENVWWEVEIVGDISSHTFDFYLDGMLEKSDLGFRHTLSGDLAGSLNYLGLQASNSGTSEHRFDDIRIDAVPGIPIIPGWGRILVVLLFVGTAMGFMRRRAAIRAA